MDTRTTKEPRAGEGWYGSPALVRAQQRLHAHRGWISAQRGLISLGRSLLVIDPPSPAEVHALVEVFGRVLVLCDESLHANLARALADAGRPCNDGYRLYAAPAAAVREASAGFSLTADLPAGHAFALVDEQTPDDIVAQIQGLHVVSGLDPLPGGFLRGRQGGCRTFYVIGPDRAVIGCGTSQDLTPAGTRFDGWSLGQSVCLAPALRGRGVGRLLTYLTNALGVERFGVHHVSSVVARGVAPSVRIGAEMPTPNRVLFIDAEPTRDTP